MQPTKNTREELLLKLIKNDFFTRKRRPSPVKIYSLKEAIKKVNNHLLAKEIAYALSTEVYYRLTYEERYKLAFNVIPLKSWETVAVFQKTKKLQKFNNLICIDYKDYNLTFIKDHPIFAKLLLTELKLIRQI
jgi:hypothetical protein